MRLFKRLLGRETRDAKTVKSSDPYLAEFFGMGGGVNNERASGLAVAHACIRTISEGLSAVPAKVYRRDDNGGREPARDHPLYGVLHDMANPAMTAFEAREFLIASLLITGNAYARLEWNGRGQAFEMHPLDPRVVAVEKLDSGRLRYRVSDPRGGVTIHTQEEILHIRYRLAPDGVMGLSSIHIARETFSLGLAQVDTAGKQAARSYRPSGALVTEASLGMDTERQLLDKLRRKAESTDSMGGILVLDGNFQWKPFPFSNRDAEFLESRKLTNLDICRIYGVPPTVVGITDHATYSNVDGESKALVVRCLAPMARRIEQAMNAAMLPRESRKTLFIEHDLSGLLRGDQKARYDAYRIGREWGWLSPNEIRQLENLPKIESGDEYLSPLNMTPIEKRE